MTDIERARECAVDAWHHWTDIGDVQVNKIRAGQVDDAPVVQSALLAIQAEREQASVLADALQYIRENVYYHSVYVSIIDKALAAYGDGHE